MNVATILRHKGRSIASAPAEASLQQIAQRLSRDKIGALLILDANGELEGIVSERDVVRAIAEHGPSCLERAASDFMTRNVVTCGENDSVAGVMGVMTDGRFRHMPVVSEGALAGVVSIGDVVRSHISEVEMEASALKSYLAAG